MILSSLVFGQDMDSREGDSLALVAIKKANPGSVIDTLTGANAWVEGNSISSWKGVTVTDQRVDSLYFFDFGLAGLPAEFGNLTQLISFSAPYNRLATLPREIGNLSKLTTLFVINNELEILPIELGSLTNLLNMSFFSNKLVAIPSEVGSLVKLKILDLGKNNLRSLPTEITKLTLTGLVSVDYNYLSVASIDYSIAAWLDKYDRQKSWRTTQKDPSPILSTTHAKSVSLTATISGKTLTLSTSVPAGSSVAMYDLTGRKILVREIAGSSMALPTITSGVYIAEILAGKSSVVQKVRVE